jgi:hypothetical protein
MPKPFTIEVPLSPDAVVAQLAPVLEPVPFMGGISAPKEHIRFWGSADAQRLALRLPERGRNSFRAWLMGSIESTGRGTRIHFRASGFGFVPVFLLVWLSLVGSWSLAAYRRGDSQTALILCGMLAFGLWLGTVGWFIYKGQAEELETRIRATLDAH